MEATEKHKGKTIITVASTGTIPLFPEERDERELVGHFEHNKESISKRGLANEVNGLSVLCLRWKSLKTEDANELPILDRGRRSESAPRFEIRSDN